MFFCMEKNLRNGVYSSAVMGKAIVRTHCGVQAARLETVDIERLLNRPCTVCLAKQPEVWVVHCRMPLLRL